jgi:hypothetical protein
MLENKIFLLLTEFGLDHKGLDAPVQGVVLLYMKHWENDPIGFWPKYNSNPSFHVHL